MSEAKFTPGPWLTQNDYDGEWSIWARQPHIGTLATVHTEDMNGEFPAMGNARLIAAAPEMYEALCKAKKWLAISDDPRCERDFKAVESALAKARGEN